MFYTSISWITSLTVDNNKKKKDTEKIFSEFCQLQDKTDTDVTQILGI